MVDEDITLIDPTVELEEAFRSMVAEYAHTDEYRYQEIAELADGGAGFAAAHAAGRQAAATARSVQTRLMAFLSAGVASGRRSIAPPTAGRNRVALDAPRRMR